MNNFSGAEAIEYLYALRVSLRSFRSMASMCFAIIFIVYLLADFLLSCCLSILARERYLIEGYNFHTTEQAVLVLPTNL